MNPETNKFEHLGDEGMERGQESMEDVRAMYSNLVRPDGTPVPKHWSIFQVGEKYVINDYTFECKYIGETSILFEPVGPIVIGEGK